MDTPSETGMREGGDNVFFCFKDKLKPFPPLPFSTVSFRVSVALSHLKDSADK